ncbi:glycosyltransferase family 4 protein [Aquimarina muelleri]|uniref:Glycosyl transferase family 1 domain-containing protein n=1 Tax=Aquimarina muelleri TaxID=279356 RepID=A0A918JU26_9FLAO|nr:glycosyltransferase family 1 protein [Aquimarina muelleri]MCX2761258.1 glycosyltransferase family 4 protein [Aquimarina muelleri]GGX09436.1 hypothetical protein GCM10007384_09110 [Aquimarina muelleri]
MKKIFLETHNINNQYTGFGQFNLHLLKGLYHHQEKDIEFTVHTKKIKPLKKIFKNYFKYKRYFGFRRYKETRIRKKYNIWHSLNQNTKIEPYYNIPYVLTIHDVNFVEEISDDHNHPRNIRFKEKLDRANAITYISEYAKRKTHQHFEIPKVDEYVIYNGNPSQEKLDLTNHIPTINIKEKYFFALGDFHERKNFHLLVEMMLHLKEHKLIIAGNDERPYGEKVKKLIESLNLKDRVILAGKISEIEKQYYFKNCTAFLFPSIREGFGLPPIEAMGFGTPVFLANETSLPEIGGEHAFYWLDLDPKNMANVIQKELVTFNKNKKEYQKKIIEQASLFDWNIASKKYLEVYKILLNQD